MESPYAIRTGTSHDNASRGRWSTAPKTPDRFTPADIGRVRLTGLLGKHVASVLGNRLLNGQSEVYVRVIEHPADKDGWRAEHVGKWIETACNTWRYTRDAALRRKLDNFVARVINMQQPDGWLGSYAPEIRFHKMDWRSFRHEQGLISFDLWCHHLTLGGLINYGETTGDTGACDAAGRIADLIVSTFGDDRQDITTVQHDRGIGAASVIYQMARLYGLTGEPRYLEFCRYIVRQYGRRGTIPILMTEMREGGYPFPPWAHIKHCEFELNLLGLGELHRLTGEKAPLVTCQNIYDGHYLPQFETACMHGFKTPPAGSRAPRTYYDYLETCDVPTILRWFVQMAQLTGESTYLDALEWNLYNAFLARNLPDGSVWPGHQEFRGGIGRRTGITSDITHCCHSMLPLGLSLIPSWCYFEAPSGVLVNLYEPSVYTTQQSGVGVRIEQATAYPMDGDVVLSVEPDRPVSFDLFLRIPGWCQAAQVLVNGESYHDAEPRPGSLLRLHRLWEQGDRVSLRLAMPTRVTRREYADNQGDPVLTVERGPLLLAVTERFNTGLRLDVVSPLIEAGDRHTAPEAGDALERIPVQDTAGVSSWAFRARGITIEEDAGKPVNKIVPIVLVPYAEAGAGDRFVVEFPPEERLRDRWLCRAEADNLALAARGAVATADSEHDAASAAARVNDGVCVADNEYTVQQVADGFDTFFNATANRWCSSTTTPHPHWVTIKLPEPATLGRIVIRFADPDGHPVDFRGLVIPAGGDEAKEVFCITEYPDRHVFATAIAPVVTDTFRLVISRSANLENPNAAEVSEIELYPAEDAMDVRQN